MGSFITLWAFCFALLVINLMLNGSGTEAADCSEYPAGIGYSTPEDCSSNCTDYCKSQLACEDLTNPCDPNYPRNLGHPCDTCDPCNYCRDYEGFYPCEEIIRFPRHKDKCDPCKRCPDNNKTDVDFCSSKAGTPPPPPPVEPAPSFNYCSNPFSGGICKQTLFSNGTAACFCTYCD